MESYQAIYDAVRSRISHCNAHDAISRAANEAFGTLNTHLIQQEFCIAAAEMARPSAIYRPSLGMDGTKWCALYGEDLMNGVAGFGDTPAEAMRDFDVNWASQRTPDAIRLDPGRPVPKHGSGP